MATDQSAEIAALKATVEGLHHRVEEQAARQTEFLRQSGTMASDLGALRTEVARHDERYATILSTMTDMDARLKGMENLPTKVMVGVAVPVAVGLLIAILTGLITIGVN